MTLIMILSLVAWMTLATLRATRPVCDLRLAKCSPTDFVGLPFPKVTR